MPVSPPAVIETLRDAAGVSVLALRGRLDSTTTGAVWREAMSLVEGAARTDLVVDASGLEYCDGAGASLLMALRARLREAGARVELRGLAPDTAQLVDLIAPSETAGAEAPPLREGFVAQLGRATLQTLGDLRVLVVFVGELTVMLARAARHPSEIRFGDLLLVAERAGIGAVPIMALVGFLLGLILAFQSVIPMQRFGAAIFVADFLGIAMFRELGPLMAGILLTARSGSAFAAELGTMKVNEELDALSTMGLEPVRFLVVPRVMAAILVVPTLTMLVSLAGLAGGAIVFLSLDFPLVTYVNRVVDATSLSDLVGGLAKSLVLGLIVAGVGCLRGLQTGTGAGAVGDAATRSVVSGIVLIAVAEGAFAVLFYVMGW